MKTRLLLSVFALLGIATVGFAQDCGGGSCGGASVGGYGYGNETYAQCVGPHGYPPRGAAVVYAARDHVHPQPLYAYSRHGIDATRVNAWNHDQMTTYPWHGGYSYHVYGQPTALVVPPTAAFQTVYQWGVANTQSVPIHHQFGAGYPGVITSGGGYYPATPYWPSSTQQFGIYPVRAPW
jgi:hypothetical protein